MTSEFVRDNAATAAVFGFFASAWFGWAQEKKPPTSWRNALAAGSIVSLLIAVPRGVAAGIPLIYFVAALVTLAAVVSVSLARHRGLAISALTAALVGAVLLLAAMFSLAVVLL